MTTSAVAPTPQTTKSTINSTVTPIAVEDGPLFPAKLISSAVIDTLPENYTIRPLRRSDYHHGYLDVLRVLTTVGDISEEQWNERYAWIASRSDEYYMLVICDGDDRIVGTGTLVAERKFIHSLGMVGHIEDIAVEKNQQGKKLGLRIIQALDSVAAEVGCYKVCLLKSPSHCSILTAFFRAFWIAPRLMRVSTSSVASSALVLRWLTITERVLITDMFPFRLTPCCL